MFDTYVRWPPPIILPGACGWESLHVPLGISSRLSRIECPLGSGPKAPGVGWAGDTMGFKKKEKKKILPYVPYIFPKLKVSK